MSLHKVLLGNLESVPCAQANNEKAVAERSFGHFTFLSKLEINFSVASIKLNCFPGALIATQSPYICIYNILIILSCPGTLNDYLEITRKIL